MMVLSLLWLALGSAENDGSLSLRLNAETTAVSLDCPEPGLYFLACVYPLGFRCSADISKDGESLKPLYLNENYPVGAEGGGLVSVFLIDEGRTGKYDLRLISEDTGRVSITALRSPLYVCEQIGPQNVRTIKTELSTQDDPVVFFLLASEPVECKTLAPGNTGIAFLESAAFSCHPFFVPKSGEYSFVIKSMKKTQKVIFAVFKKKSRLKK